jgi:hypothetical protein
MDTVRFKFRTGDDALRHDSLLRAQFVFNNQTTLIAVLHQIGEPAWKNDSLHRRDVNVSGQPPITQVTLQFIQGGGGLSGDNWGRQSIWSMQDVEVYAACRTDPAVAQFYQGGGINADNWSMQDVEVYADGVEDEAHLLHRALGVDGPEERCAHRFEGNFKNDHEGPTYSFFPRSLPTLQFFSRQRAPAPRRPGTR